MQPISEKFVPSLLTSEQKQWRFLTPDFSPNSLISFAFLRFILVSENEMTPTVLSFPVCP